MREATATSPSSLTWDEPCPCLCCGDWAMVGGMGVEHLQARLPSHPVIGRVLWLPQMPVPMDPGVQGHLRLVRTRGNGAHPSQVKDAPCLRPSAPAPGSVAPTPQCLWGPTATTQPVSRSQSSTGQASIGTSGHQAAHGVLGRSSLHGICNKPCSNQCLQQH